MRPDISVLIVDDDLISRQIIGSMLEALDCKVTSAEDGVEAYRIFKKSFETKPFELIISDIMMPNMDGFDLVRKIREIDKFVPTVFLSSQGQKETIKKALRIGVKDFIEKPVTDLETIRKTIEPLIPDIDSHDDSMEQFQTTEAVKKVQVAFDSQLELTDHLQLVAHHLEAWKSAGGDVVKVFKRNDSSLLFAIADVAGHSVETSYAVAAILGILGVLRNEEFADGTLLKRLNEGVLEGPFPQIPVSIMLLHWQPWNGRVHIQNAGMPHGLLFHKDRCQVSSLPLDGLPLGYLDQVDYDEKITFLRPGDRLLMGSDGLFEAEPLDATNINQTLSEFLIEHKDTAITELPKRIYQKCQAICGAITDDFLAFIFQQSEFNYLEQQHFWSVPSSLKIIDAIIDQIENLVHNQYQGNTVVTLDLVLLAIREAFLNAVIHGNGSRDDHYVAIHLEFQKAEFTCEISDEGQGYDENQMKALDDDLRIGGRGTEIIEQFATWHKRVGNTLSLGFKVVEDNIEND